MFCSRTAGAIAQYECQGFYGAVGVAAPQHRVDFETGFADEQNVSGRAALFPGGLVVRDTGPSNQAIGRGRGR